MKIDSKYLIDSEKTKKELNRFIITSLNVCMIEETSREAVTRVLTLGFQQGMLFTIQEYIETDCFENIKEKFDKVFESFFTSFLVIQNIPEKEREAYKKILFSGFSAGVDFSIKEFNEKKEG